MHPYKVVEVSPFAFYFRTTQQSIYYCLFRDVTYISPLLGIYDIHVFEFQFFESPDQGRQSAPRHLSDEKIGGTIVSILQSFFQIKDRIVVYLCDSSDDKHKARQKLFQLWNQRFPNTVTNIPLVITDTISDGEYELYGGLMYAGNFEEKQLIQDYLIDKAKEIFAEKYDGGDLF